MTIKIQIQNNESLVEIILDRDVNAKKAFEIQKILKRIGNEIVERGIKNDVKNILKKEKNEEKFNCSISCSMFWFGK